MSRSQFLEGLIRVRRRELLDLEQQMEERRREERRLLAMLEEIETGISGAGGAMTEDGLDPWLMGLQSSRLEKLMDRRMLVREALAEEQGRAEVVRERLGRSRHKLEILEDDLAQSRRNERLRLEQQDHRELIESHVARGVLRLQVS